MKIKAILPVYSEWSDGEELFKLEKTLENFFKHNPSIPVTVINDGGKSPVEIVRKFDNCYLIEDKKNSWVQNSKFNFTGAPGFLWFKRLYQFAEQEDYTHILYLETDVLTRYRISRVPKYEIAGCGFVSWDQANDFYCDFFGLPKTKHIKFKDLTYEGNDYHNEISFLHYGTGGTIFSKSFFEKTSKNLNIIERLGKEHSSNFLQDLAITALAHVSDCSIGEWEDVCTHPESAVWLKEDVYRKENGTEALVHQYNFK